MELKNVAGYEGIYMVNRKGEIFSLPKKTRKGIRKLKPLKQVYEMVDLCKDGEAKKYTVHRLVAKAFIPNHENKEQVNHINGNKFDNRVENLEWCTRSENQLHSTRIGLRTAKGVKNSQSKLKEHEVIEIYKSKESNKYLSEKYKISIPSISGIRNNKDWTHITIKF